MTRLQDFYVCLFVCSNMQCMYCKSMCLCTFYCWRERRSWEEDNVWWWGFGAVKFCKWYFCARVFFSRFGGMSCHGGLHKAFKRWSDLTFVLIFFFVILFKFCLSLTLCSYISCYNILKFIEKQKILIKICTLGWSWIISNIFWFANCRYLH